MPSEPFEIAQRIVRDVFGEFYVGTPPTERIGRQFPYREVFVRPECNFEKIEPSVQAALDEIGWQLALVHSVDDRRYKWFQEASQSAIKRHCNIYALAPICLIEEPPPLVYHVTEALNVASCRSEGIKASDGKHGYPDTKGRIHVCEKLGEGPGTAEWWAACFSKNRGIALADFSILEITLGPLRGARVHKDFHSESGIIIDRTEAIPPQMVAREIRLS